MSVTGQYKTTLAEKHLIMNIRSHDVRKHTLVTKMREMVSFEFVKEMEKDVFRCVFDERERKNL